MKTLETKRMILRKFNQNDFQAVHSYAGVSENIVYMVWGPNNEDQTKAFIDMAIEQAEKEPCNNFQYAVVEKSSKQLIGACNLAITADEAEIGWILHRDFWKQGYGTEMGERLLSFGFDTLHLHRILAHCDADNQASFHLMKKIGMRKEGLFIEARPANKNSDAKYSDELSCAITKDEWDTKQEIAYYRNLPFIFKDFIELPELSDGIIHLVCITKNPAIPEKKYVPGYRFAICKGAEKIGEIDLRIGYDGYGPDSSSLYYGGQIGYNVSEAYRGNGYAGRACCLLLPVAKAHSMTKLLITNNYTNTASRRVCEKLGARFIRVARLPEWNDLYKEGQRFSNIFEWSVE